MAAIPIACPACAKKLAVRDELAGKKVKCPGCGHVVSVPAPQTISSTGASEQRTLPPALREQATIDQAPQAQQPEQTSPSLSQPDNTLSPNPPDADPALTDFLAPAEAADELGRLGGFRILKILGHGGMGVVFLAEDPRLSRKVAIKAMLPHLAQSRTSQQRFLREAKAAAALEHDHIVPILQVGEDRGAPFIVMPFLKGEALDKRLHREGKLPLGEVIRIGREIASGLAAAHKEGLIHRDIKPANVWLETNPGRESGEGRVKILDFGLARAGAQNEGLTQQGAIVGTPSYMAPEQARGDEVDLRCDLWALGVVLYRMATGQMPFVGKDTVSTLMAVAMNEPSAPSQLNQALPTEFSALVMKLLAKDISQRYQTASEVVQALSKIEASGVRQPPDSSEPARNPVQKNQGADAPRSPRRALPWFAGGLFALVLAAAGIVFFIPSGNGTIRVEITDPTIEVALTATGAKIKATDGLVEIHLAPGEHGLRVKRGDLEFETDKIVLKKGETITLKAEWLKDRLAMVRADDGKIVGAKWVPISSNSATAQTVPQILQFTGKCKVRFPTMPVEPDQQLTLECWVTPEPQGYGTRYIMGFGEAKLSMGESSMGHANLSFNLNYQTAITARYEVGKLVHVAGVRSGHEFRLYIDGKLVGTKMHSLPLVTEKSKEAFLGEYSGATFKGSIGEVRFSKTARYGKDFTPQTRFEPDADTIGLYHCDEGQGDILTDSSGNGHHGKIVGAKWVKADGSTAPPVAGGTGLKFSGQDSVTFERPLDYDDKSFTIETWVLPEPNPPGGIVYVLNAMNGLQTNPEGSWRFSYAHDPMGFSNISRPPPIEFGKRIHVAAVSDADGFRLFLNGKLASGSPKGQDRVLRRGTGAPRMGIRFVGTIDELRVSRTPRYKSDFTPAPEFAADKDTIALYHFDEGEGDILKDSSGNGHHGKIIGAKWVQQKESFLPHLKAALKFEAKPVYFSKPIDQLDPRSFTLEAYIRNEAVGSYTILGQLKTSIIAGSCYWRLYYSGAEGKSLFVSSKSPIEIDRWVHVAGVGSPEGFYLFVDGQKVGQAPQLKADDIIFQKGLTALGDNFFKGFLAEIRISKVPRYQADFIPAQRFEPDADTLALFHCDEGEGRILNDSSGNGHHGKIVGAKWVKASQSPVEAPPNFALRFDGNNRVDIPGIKLPTNGPYTMEGYFHPDEDKTGGVDNHTMGVPFQSHLNYTKGSNWRWVGGKGKEAKVNLPNIPAPNRRHHVACVYDGKERRFYLDGQQAGKPISAPEIAVNRNFELGGAFSGTIDEVRVSKVARYDQNFIPAIRFEPDANTIALYHCDEGEGDVLFDSSGNEHHGKIVGAKWVPLTTP